MTLLPNIEKRWEAIPDTSQELALNSPCHHTLYTGTRGPGKTDTQLMKFRRRVGIGYGEFWRGIIFDREYKNLDDLIVKSKRWFYRIGQGAKFLESASSYKWVWPTGEELLFRVVKKADDYWSYHGHEYTFIGWNELTKFPTGELYDTMLSTNRSSFVPGDYPIWVDKEAAKQGIIQLVPRTNRNAVQYELPEIPLEVFSTTNPYGPGHNWVKRKFIDPAPYGHVVRKYVEVINPRTKELETVEKTQVAIFGKYTENIYLSPEYVSDLETQKDPNRRKAWATGSWDIVAGGALDDVYEKHIHEIPRFVVPATWRIDRAFDWGSSHPFSVGWFAEANGEEAEIIENGQVRKFCPPAGTLIQIFEWYGAEEIGENKGLKLSAVDIARGIRDREMSLLANGWIKTQPWGGPADNQIRDVRESDVETIEAKMKKEGISWVDSDKSPGSRRNGLQLIRDRLEAATRGEGQGLYFMNNCRASIATIPVLPRDSDKPDDVDTDAEDHCYDMVRYRVLKSSTRHATKVNVSMPT